MTSEIRDGSLRLVPIDARLLSLVADPSTFAAAIDAEPAEPFPDPDLADLLAMHAGRLADDPLDPEYGPWLVIDDGRGVLVGSTGFHGPPEPDGTVEIGYGIAASERRRGHATASARALTAWALARPEVTRVVARGVVAANEPSIRVLERLGYRRTREGEGTVDWEITG